MKMQGFSLLEVLITFSIILVLLVIVIPSQGVFLKKTSTDVMKMQLLRAINLTRSEAIARDEIVTLCPSSNQKTCTGVWGEGYLIYANEKILYCFHNTVNKALLHWRSFPRQQQYLKFLPSGFSSMQNGTFWYCAENASNPSWAIMVSQSGRARVVYPAENGKIMDDKKTFLKC
jgi:type IV fimbrial biogenesis protein FimT